MLDVPYASAAAIAAEALSLLLPPERLSVPEHAAQRRLLDNAGGGHVGLWENERTPYTVRPSECLDSLDYQTVAVVGPGQVAKTVIAENWLLKSVDLDPANMLWYMQTDDAVESYVKSRINPMIDLHEEILRSRLGRKATDNSLHFKQFRGMSVEFLAASARTLINKSAPRLIADEIDAWMLLGDPKALLDVRRQTFGIYSMLLAMSHCDRAKGLNPETDWSDGIMSIYADSDRHVWYWPCPHCGAWSSPAPIARRVMTIEYDADPEASLDDVERSAHLLCPVNGCVIEDHQHVRRDMNLAAYRSPFGGWVGLGQELSEGGELTGELVRRETAGFWIVGAMSPFVMGGIGGLVRRRVKAERDFENSGEDASLREIIVKHWGIPYSRPKAAGSIEAKDLVERVEDLPRGIVPDWVRFLVVSVDVQLVYFEYLVRGFGPGGESVIIDTGKIAAQPATEPDDWDRMRDMLAGAAYPIEGRPDLAMTVRAFGFDSQGQAGVTQQARDAWARWKRAGHVRNYGLIGGRPAFNHIPLRGANGVNPPRLIVTFPDTGSAQNKASKPGEVPVGQFAPNQFKSDLMGQLQRAEPGPWFVHLPAWLKSKTEPHVWFEQVTAEHQLANGKWEKRDSAARNEALDLMVMSHVVAHLHGLTRIDWARPPAWALPWDLNPLVKPVDAAASPPADPKAPAGVRVIKPDAPPRPKGGGVA